MRFNLTKKLILFALAVICVPIVTLSTHTTLKAQQPPAPLLINNVRIFDGVNDQLRSGNVLLLNRKIKQISSSPISAPSGSVVINGGGRELMPGLTDAHWHMTFAPNALENLEQPDTGLNCSLFLAGSDSLHCDRSS